MKPPIHHSRLDASSRTSLGLAAVSLAIGGYTASSLLPLVGTSQQPKILALMLISLCATVVAVWRVWRSGNGQTSQVITAQTQKVTLDQHFDQRDCTAFDLSISHNRHYIAIDCNDPATRSSLIVQINDENALTLSVFDGDSENTMARHIVLGKDASRRQRTEHCASLERGFKTKN